MKRVLLAAIVALSLAMLSGCHNKAGEEKIHDQKYPGFVYEYTDPDQGVEYLLWKCGFAGGITPRLTQDGTPKVVE